MVLVSSVKGRGRCVDTKLSTHPYLQVYQAAAQVPSPLADLHISREEEEALSCSLSPSHGGTPKLPKPHQSPAGAFHKSLGQGAPLKSPGLGAHPNPNPGVKWILFTSTHVPLHSIGTWEEDLISNDGNLY